MSQKSKLYKMDLNILMNNLRPFLEDEKYNILKGNKFIKDNKVKDNYLFERLLNQLYILYIPENSINDNINAIDLLKKVHTIEKMLMFFYIKKHISESEYNKKISVLFVEAGYKKVCDNFLLDVTMVMQEIFEPTNNNSKVKECGNIDILHLERLYQNLVPDNFPFYIENMVGKSKYFFCSLFPGINASKTSIKNHPELVINNKKTGKKPKEKEEVKEIEISDEIQQNKNVEDIKIKQEITNSTSNTDAIEKSEISNEIEQNEDVEDAEISEETSNVQFNEEEIEQHQYIEKLDIPDDIEITQYMINNGIYRKECFCGKLYEVYLNGHPKANVNNIMTFEQNSGRIELKCGHDGTEYKGKPDFGFLKNKCKQYEDSDEYRNKMFLFLNYKYSFRDKQIIYSENNENKSFLVSEYIKKYLEQISERKANVGDLFKLL